MARLSFRSNETIHSSHFLASFSMTPLQLAILRHIHRYHFLTNRQLFTLGLGNQQVIRRATRQLATTPRKSPNLIRKSFPPHARLGRMAHVFSLGDRGKRYVEEESQVPLAKPILSTLTTNDYFHRLAVVDVRIALEQLPEISIPWFVSYFELERTEHQLRPLLRLDFADGSFVVPDGAFAIRGKERNAVFLLEYVRGYRQQRTIDQITRHTRLMVEDVMRQKGNLPDPPKVLFIFEHTSHARSIWKRMTTSGWFAPFANAFLFAPMEAFIHNPVNCWRMVHHPHLISLSSL